jgi:DNA-binding NarL/FixJ family response regulator
MSVLQPLNKDRGLSPMQMKVLKGAARGLTNRQIADQHNISENTARRYFDRLSARLGTRRRIEAVVEAIKRGIIDVNKL